MIVARVTTRRNEMIRQCTEKDEAIWTKLNREFMEYEYEDDNVWENPADQGDPAEIFREIIGEDQSSNRLFIVEEENQIIGFMNTSIFYSIWAHGQVLFLDDYFISEKFQGKGYGKKALGELEELLKKEGYKRIQLLAEDTNPGAVKFYTREGYSKQKINFFCKYL